MKCRCRLLTHRRQRSVCGVCCALSDYSLCTAAQRIWSAKSRNSELILKYVSVCSFYSGAITCSQSNVGLCVSVCDDLTVESLDIESSFWYACVASECLGQVCISKSSGQGQGSAGARKIVMGAKLSLGGPTLPPPSLFPPFPPPFPFPPLPYPPLPPFSSCPFSSPLEVGPLKSS